MSVSKSKKSIPAKKLTPKQALEASKASKSKKPIVTKKAVAVAAPAAEPKLELDLRKETANSYAIELLCSEQHTDTEIAEKVLEKFNKKVSASFVRSRIAAGKIKSQEQRAIPRFIRDEDGKLIEAVGKERAVKKAAPAKLKISIKSKLNKIPE
jgi:hypothetical protein